MVNSEEFAERLEKIIEYYSLSATAFADKIEFNRSTISHLLSGRNKPSLDFVMKVIENFPDVELYWLLNGKGSFPSENFSERKSEQRKDSTDLFSGKKETNQSSEPSKDKSSVISSNILNDSEIERIVVFFKNGTFKAYENG